MPSTVSQHLEAILSRYLPARREGEGGPFGRAHPVWDEFEAVAEGLRSMAPTRPRPTLQVKWSPGQGNWARVPWIALMDRRETETTQEGVYGVFLFREDMSGVYLTWNQGVTQLKNLHGTREARRILRDRANKLAQFLPADRRGFRTGDGIDLRSSGGLGKNYEHSTIAFRLYEAGATPDDEEIEADLEVVLQAYDQYMQSDLRKEFDSGVKPERLTPPDQEPPQPFPPKVVDGFSLATAAEEVASYIDARGFVYEPWQVAQYLAALRTKPFVILAGITGTGKSKLPRLVAEATGGNTELVPVRPDWTDSSEVLGYIDLEGAFRPGSVLEVAHGAMAEEDRHHTLIIDEMNLARVEHYFAEVLSHIEDRRPGKGGGFESSPLIRTELREEDREWGEVRLPPNLALVGTVNMDESAHGFSRKVLDRAFTVELSEVDLGAGLAASNPSGASGRAPSSWPVPAWFPRATRLSELGNRRDSDQEQIERAIQALRTVNRILTPAQLQVGYRSRDEVCLFTLHADELRALFRTSWEEPVDPLDLALQMKILPRIAGGSGAIRRVLLGLLGWAWGGQPLTEESDAHDRLREWEEAGRPLRIPEADYPGVAGRAALMFDRLQVEGFTSYWL
jgi:hypothetical protein